MITAFTIIFITIMSTTVRRYTLWKAQSGAYISDLEQLHASISLPSTIKMVFYLKKFTILSLGLVSIWSFYYLGSQANKREYVFALSDASQPVKAAYPNDAQFFEFGPSRGEESVYGEVKNLNTEFNDHLDSPGSNGLDSFGFLLIPEMRMEVMEYRWNGPQPLSPPRRRSSQELQEWMTVHPKLETYTELLLNTNDFYKDKYPGSSWWDYIGTAEGMEGIKVTGDLTLAASYFSVECGSVDALPLQEFPTGVAKDMRTSFNLTSFSNSSGNPTQQVTSFTVWHRWNETYNTHSTDEAPTINGMTNGTLKITRTITEPKVEMKVHCPDGACVAKNMRYLPSEGQDHAHVSPFANTTWASGFFDNLLWSSGAPSMHKPDDNDVQYALETYKFINFLSPNGYSDTKEYLLLQYGRTLTKLFDTYFNIAAIGNSRDNPSDKSASFDYFTFDGALYEPQYRLNWAWINLDYLSCGILLTASIFSFWLRKNTLAPDIFGYVSSLTRDNPYIPVTEGGSTLSGIDRAKHMEKVKIKIGDVGPSSEEAKVGIVYVHDDIGVAPPSKSRKYL